MNNEQKRILIEVVAWLLIVALAATGWQAWRRITSWSEAQVEALAPEVAPAVNAVSVNASLWPDRAIVVSDPGEPQVIVGPDGVTTFFGTASFYDYDLDAEGRGYPCPSRSREASQPEGRSKRCYTHGKAFAAMRDVPRGRSVTVTNLANRKSTIVKITDYGPDEDLHPDRVIDLTSYAFSQIADLGDGLIEVKVTWGD